MGDFYPKLANCCIANFARRVKYAFVQKTQYGYQGFLGGNTAFRDVPPRAQNDLLVRDAAVDGDRDWHLRDGSGDGGLDAELVLRWLAGQLVSLRSRHALVAPGRPGG